MELAWMTALQEAGVDTGGALRRFSGNSGLYWKFLLKFPQDDTFEKIHPALQANDWEAALAAAHTLKGVAANLGLTPLFDASAQIVSLLREEAVASYEKLRQTYSKLVEIIRSTGEAQKNVT